MDFKIVGPIQDIEIIAHGHGIKNVNRLNKIYGKAHWRKLKGTCTIELPDGVMREAEVHWYEGHGIGKKEVKLKKYL